MPPHQDPTTPMLVTASNGIPELARYFEDLDFLFEDCLIQSDAAKKRHTARYLDTPTARLWQGLEPSYTAGSYEQWKTAIHALYPGTLEDRRYSIRDLEALVNQWSEHGIASLLQLSEFYRQFIAVSSLLVSKQRLSTGERDRAFQTAFDRQQWTKIHERLMITDVNHHPEDPWPVPSIYAAAQYILFETTPSILHTFRPPPSAPLTTPAPPTIPQPQPSKPVEAPHASSAPQVQDPAEGEMQPVTPKEEVVLQVFHQILTRLEQLQPRGHKIREIECYFCSETGHRIQECPQVEPSIQAGKCRRDAAHRIVLPSGARIPNHVPGNNLREKIDECYRRSAENRRIGHTPVNDTFGTFLYTDRCPRTPSSKATAFDEQIRFREQLRRLRAHDVPAPTSIATPFEPSRFHEPNASAPVSTFHTSISPWPTPTKSNITPTATSLPPPTSSPPTLQQTTTTRTPPTNSSKHFSRTSYAGPIFFQEHRPAYRKLAPAFHRPLTLSTPAASVPIEFRPASTAPVSHSPPFFAAPLLAPAVLSKENATETPVQPQRLDQTPTTSIIATATATHATSTAPTQCRLPPVERAATTTKTPARRTTKSRTRAKPTTNHTARRPATHTFGKPTTITPASAAKNAVAASKLKITTPIARPFDKSAESAAVSTTAPVYSPPADQPVVAAPSRARNTLVMAHPPLAGKPPFATDLPDSFYEQQPAQPRQRQQPPPNPNARTSTYDVYNNYITDDKRQSGAGALGLGLLNMADDSDDEDDDNNHSHASHASKHAALTAATAKPIAAPQPGYAAPIAALNLARGPQSRPPALQIPAPVAMPSPQTFLANPYDDPQPQSRMQPPLSPPSDVDIEIPLGYVGYPPPLSCPYPWGVGLLKASRIPMPPYIPRFASHLGTAFEPVTPAPPANNTAIATLSTVPLKPAPGIAATATAVPSPTYHGTSIATTTPLTSFITPKLTNLVNESAGTKPTTRVIRIPSRTHKPSMRTKLTFEEGPVSIVTHKSTTTTPAAPAKSNAAGESTTIQITATAAPVKNTSAHMPTTPTNCTTTSTASTEPVPMPVRRPAPAFSTKITTTASIAASASIPAADITPASSTSQNLAVAPSPAPSCAASNVSSRLVDLILPSRIPRLKRTSTRPSGVAASKACILSISADRIFGVAALPR
ncbi:hypothetical protein H0H81_003151 [Sphagnurus paluster]|uniref:CCHC-type domain-containing protein n=1 Tax=Sphagnurus paluster TaxID=117069 RepID=A0A9P7KIA7_9AGAR|nr:hypothetical protein H0H81_003151 [Sphagnurus paluster]